MPLIDKESIAKSLNLTISAAPFGDKFAYLSFALQLMIQLTFIFSPELSKLYINLTGSTDHHNSILAPNSLINKISESLDITTHLRKLGYLPLLLLLIFVIVIQFSIVLWILGLNWLTKTLSLDYMAYKDCFPVRVLAVLMIYYEPVHFFSMMIGWNSVLCKQEYTLNSNTSSGSAFATFSTGNSDTISSGISKSMGTFANVSNVNPAVSCWSAQHIP
jgi:hypothetical protein